MKIAVIGAGLAGCECAWILATHYGVKVSLFDMKPAEMSPAHEEPALFAELVCSNSLKSKSMLNPAGVLKEEMKALGSLLMPIAEHCAVPAGEALAVDRKLFSSRVTEKIAEQKNIEVIPARVDSLQKFLSDSTWGAIVVAVGPLAGGDLIAEIGALVGQQTLYFYDAIAPVLDGASIDMSIAVAANRKLRGQIEDDSDDSAGDYLNLFLNREEYNSFVSDLLSAEKMPFRSFEEPRFFSGCQPIEELAASGPRTLSFGPMRPRGFTDPRTGRWPWAVVQLRREKSGNEAFNLVGFQTRLTWPEQKRVFRKLPGLANAEFFRLGSMHRNNYFVAPAVLNRDLSLRVEPRVFLAGQVAGVEGYVESAALGVFVAHVLGCRLVKGVEFSPPPPASALGALLAALLETEPKHFSPVAINWGLFPMPKVKDESEIRVHSESQRKPKKLDKSQRRALLSAACKDAFDRWLVAAF